MHGKGYLHFEGSSENNEMNLMFYKHFHKKGPCAVIRLGYADNDFWGFPDNGKIILRDNINSAELLIEIETHC